MANALERKEFDPAGLTAARLFSELRESPASAKKIIAHFRDIQNFPFNFGTSAASEAVKFLAAINLISASTNVDDDNPEAAGTADGMDDSKKAKLKPEEVILAVLSRHEGMAEAIASQIKNLRLSTCQIGSHTAKIPNTSASGRTIFQFDTGIFEAAATLPLVSSATTRADFRIGGGTNAAQNATNRFLLTSAVIGNEVVNFGDSIRTKGVVFEELVKLGAPRSDLEEIAEMLDQQREVGEDEPLGEGQKIIFWPVDQGYVQVTPVHPVAMHVEMKRRLQERRQSQQSRLPGRRVKIGGSKPQNGGVINSRFGGWHDLLKSEPPKTLDATEARRYREHVLGDIRFTRISPQNEVLVNLENLLFKHNRSNKDVRDRINSQMKRLIRVALYPFIDAQRHYRGLGANSERQEFLDRLDLGHRVLICEGYAKLANKEDFMHSLANVAMGNSMPRHDEVINDFRQAADHILLAVFQGN